MVIEAPTRPDVGDRLLIVGTLAVKTTPLLDSLLFGWLLPLASVTTTFPVVTPAGACATMLVSLQLDTGAKTPLNITLHE
jgi:hypothetical protein